jgi:hypothetical protein
MGQVILGAHDLEALDPEVPFLGLSYDDDLLHSGSLEMINRLAS